MGWTTKLLLLSLLGLSACQQRSLNGGRRRQRISAGKSEIASFNCPQDFGYYPHPSDCTQYYVCVFGGALQESCTGGLVYSHELETCDWPRNVECTPSAAGSGIAPVRSTDQRPPNSSPVRTATESLTPSVGSFDSRFEHSYTPKDSRSPQKFDGNDRSNSPRALFRQQPNPKQSLASPRFSQQSFFDTSVQESSQRPVNAKPTTFRPQVFSLQLQSRVGRVRSVRDTSASSTKLLQRDLTTLDATQDSDFGRSALEPSIPSAATARLGLASRTHEPPQSSGSTAVNPRNIPFHFLNSRPDQRSTRRQSSSQGNFFHQDAPRKQIHPQQFRRAPSSFNQHFRPPITFPRQSSPANPFGNFQSFTPFASTFDTRPFSNPAREQTRQPPIQQQLHPHRQRPRPEVASFPHRPHSDAFLQKPQPPESFLPGSHLQSFSPVAHPESFQPVPHLDPFSTKPQLESFQPGVQTGSFQPGFQSESFPTSPHRESNPSRPLPESVHSSSLNTRFPSLPKSEPFLPEEAAVRPAHDQPRKPSRPTSTSHSVKPFKPIRQTPHPLQTPRRPSPFLLEETSFPSRPSQSQLDSSPSQEPIYIPSDTRVPQRPSPTRPSKRNPTSSNLRVTPPAPRVTSPAPRVTSPAPRVTSPAPSVTSPAPRVTSPVPRVTSPAPRVTSPAPRVTSPENYPVLNSIEITDQSPKRNRRPENPLGQSVTTKPPRRQPSTFPPFSKARSTFPPFHSLSQKAPSLALPPQIPGTVHHPELSRLPVSTPKTSDLSLSSPNLLPNTQDSRQPLRSNTRRPTSVKVTSRPLVDDAFYADLNFTDPEYFYYYDDLLYDYYDIGTPAASPATLAPAPRPAPTRVPIRTRVKTSSSPSSKSFASGGGSRGGNTPSRSSSSSSSPSSSLRGSSSSSRSSANSRLRSQASSSSSASSRTPTRQSSSTNRGPPRGASSSGTPSVGSTVPKRPAPVRPHPPADTKATKCDPKVCVLPDCYCGGKDIPGGYSSVEVPQIVLLTFDDAVNDLNKGLYRELFKLGRENPNGCPIVSTMYVSHEWTDYTQVQDLYAEGHEIASHSISHSFGEQFSTTKWAKEIAGQREILAAYGGVKMEDVRGMRAPFLAVGGNKMFRMLYDQNFTYDSSMPVYENNPPSWPYTLDYRIFHDCMIPPCPTNSYPGLWQVPMVMWQDLNGGRCSMGDACTTPPDAEGVYKMLIKNFERHYTTNRAPFGLFYHAAWFTTPHHKEGFIAFLDTITAMDDVWLTTNWQLIQWMRDPTPLSRINSFGPFGCNFPDRPRCTTKNVCNVWHKGGVRYMRTCQQCPETYPWTGNTGVRSPLNDS